MKAAFVIFAIVASLYPVSLHAQAPTVGMVAVTNTNQVAGSFLFTGSNTIAGPLTIGTGGTISNPAQWRTALQITTGSGVWTPGSVSGILTADGSGNVSAAASKLLAGTGALVSGSALIATPFASGSSVILYSGSLPILTSAIVSGTSFTAVSGTASGAFRWFLINF